MTRWMTPCEIAELVKKRCDKHENAMTKTVTRKTGLKPDKILSICQLTAAVRQ